MKNLSKTLFVAVLLFASVFIYAQEYKSPDAFNYQAVIRDGSGNLVTSGTVKMRFSFLFDVSTGPVIYQETHDVSPNEYGLITAIIGDGTITSGAFSDIDWKKYDYFFRVEADPSGGNNYTDLGSVDFLSVPYALVAKHADTARVALNVDDADADSTNELQVLSINGTTLEISNGNSVTLPAGPAGATGPQGQPGPAGSANINGITNRLIKFTGATTGGNSQIYDNGANVGIGTTTPEVKLDVNGGGGLTYVSGYRYYNGGSSFGGISNASVTIRANSLIVASGFFAFSDSRIKNIENRSNPTSDLACINQLQVTDYRYIDKVSKGDKLAKGFIAQEVEKVIPEAISRTVDYIPNIYSVATKATQAANGDVLIALDTAHGLKVGDEVRLITDRKIDCVVSKVIDEKAFEVCGLEKTPEWVFVLGKKVDNFLTVDYDRIFTTGIGAIQELSKKVEKLEAENAHLRAQLENESNDLKAAIQRIEAQLGMELQGKK